MAKTVTTAFRTAWVNKLKKFAIYRIDYKRRYWNGSAFVDEANWQTMTMPKAQFKSIGTMTWNIDTVLQDEYTASNAVVSLLNNDYRWNPENRAGIFGPDAVTGAVNTTGYFAKGTQLKIYAGYIITEPTATAEAVYETLTMFSGLLVDYDCKPLEGIFDAYIVGYEDKLQNASAHLVSTAFTTEALIGTVNGSNKVFTTTSLGVAFVTAVRDNGVAKVEGADYSISGLDTPGVGATVTFVVAPAAGTPDATGTKWKASQNIDTLATLIATTAGLTSYSIDPVTFPLGVTGSKTFDSQADWDAGLVKTGVATNNPSGDIQREWILFDNFADGDFTANPVWTVSGGTPPTISGADMVLGAQAQNGPLVAAPTTYVTGAWEMSIKHLATANVPMYYIPFGSAYAGGYGFYIQPNSGGSANEVGLCDANRTGIGAGTGTAPADGTQHTYTISLDSAGVLTLKQDGVAISTATVASLASVDMFFVENSNPTALTGDCQKITNIQYCSNPTPTMTKVTTDSVWESAEQDIGSVPSVWGTLDYTQTLNGGTITYYTASATVSGGPYDAYVAISAADVIQSALKRFFKVKAVFNSAANAHVNPVLSKLVANFSTVTPVITLGMFKGDTCYQAMQKLAFVANYEMLFDGTGQFLFRSKATSAPVLTFSQSDILAKVVNIKPGWLEVINDAQVTDGSGTYIREYTSLTLPETSPTSRDKHGTKLSQQSIPFFFANDGNIATAMSQVIHDDGYLEKRRVQLECRLIPQIDVGDVIQVSFYENTLLRDNFYEDPLLEAMGWAPIFGTPGNVALRDFKCKIIQLTHDFDAGLTRMLVLEVLS